MTLLDDQEILEQQSFDVLLLQRRLKNLGIAILVGGISILFGVSYLLYELLTPFYFNTRLIKDVVFYIIPLTTIGICAIYSGICFSYRENSKKGILFLQIFWGLTCFELVFVIFYSAI